MATAKKTKSNGTKKNASRLSVAEAAAHAEKVTSAIHAAIARGLPAGTGMKMMSGSAPDGNAAAGAGGPDPWEPKIYVTISAVYQVYPPPKK